MCPWRKQFVGDQEKVWFCLDYIRNGGFHFHERVGANLSPYLFLLEVDYDFHLFHIKQAHNGDVFLLQDGKFQLELLADEKYFEACFTEDMQLQAVHTEKAQTRRDQWNFHFETLTKVMNKSSFLLLWNNNTVVKFGSGDRILL